MNTVKRTVMIVAGLMAMSGMALTGCDKKGGGTGGGTSGSTGGSMNGGSGGGSGSGGSGGGR